MTHSVVIPVMNQLHDTKGVLGLLKHITSDNTELIFIDNGSQDNYEEFIYKYLKPKKVQYIRNETNIGVLNTMQQGYEASESDIITYLHNDVFIYEKDWDKAVIEIMTNNPEIGIIGAFGASGVGPDGGRIQKVKYGHAPGFSSMLEAEVHGERIEIGQTKYVAIMDGFFMSIRRDLLKKTGGFDTKRYQWHHFYDRDICLESIRHGYKNIVLGFPIHHWSGRTANQSEYQEQIKKEYGHGHLDHTKQYVGDKATHDDNMARFGEKWGDVLPIYVNAENGSLEQQEPYKGNRIIGYEQSEQ
jgi:GT2 family glycosyltransferase